MSHVPSVALGKALNPLQLTRTSIKIGTSVGCFASPFLRSPWTSIKGSRPRDHARQGEAVDVAAVLVKSNENEESRVDFGDFNIDDNCAYRIGEKASSSPSSSPPSSPFAAIQKTLRFFLMKMSAFNHNSTTYASAFVTIGSS
ncbi:uncharacterized protein LOC111622715 [Centruroides sculpturatus]|uniref:uncharacterized protein LOC111622715 n=1 Tax=Centruroides sculpturatus TaxID=218467 RepID=UPI000C6D221C|nr:uncharacterized protein LOC111622715 [Centruroides sculpturatus]